MDEKDLLRLNASWADLDAAALPDGDAELGQLDFTGFAVPHCASCSRVMTPDVVFFGESVPRGQVALAIGFGAGQCDAGRGFGFPVRSGG